MEDQKLFELADQVHRIHLQAESGGETYDLFHNLREPTAGQWKEYQSRSSKMKSDGQNLQLKGSLGAEEWLWGQVAVSVEGYSFKGQPLACDGEDWKRRVNIIHKRRAIQELSRVWAPSGEDAEAKNSGTVSDD